MKKSVLVNLVTWQMSLVTALAAPRLAIALTTDTLTVRSDYATDPQLFVSDNLVDWRFAQAVPANRPIPRPPHRFFRAAVEAPTNPPPLKFWIPETNWVVRARLTTDRVTSDVWLWVSNSSGVSKTGSAMIPTEPFQEGVCDYEFGRLRLAPGANVFRLSFRDQAGLTAETNLTIQFVPTEPAQPPWTPPPPYQPPNPQSWNEVDFYIYSQEYTFDYELARPGQGVVRKHIEQKVGPNGCSVIYDKSAGYFSNPAPCGFRQTLAADGMTTLTFTSYGPCTIFPRSYVGAEAEAGDLKELTTYPAGSYAVWDSFERSVATLALVDLRAYTNFNLITIGLHTTTYLREFDTWYSTGEAVAGAQFNGATDRNNVFPVWVPRGGWLRATLSARGGGAWYGFWFSALALPY